ncbi:MAG: hypothetical protein IKX88_01530 [Thermoguttaceae bacterium]|nr:hypothetical protein [Thermoguttaceae bacterium]MBR5757259.1 hypothetical protein [Thermoguttaceae bacterium]
MNVTRFFKTALLSVVCGVCVSSLVCSQEVNAPNEIERMKAKYGVDASIADLTPTVCAVAGIRAPKTATANQIEKVVDGAKTSFDGRPAQKVLIYCGDCIGDVLLQKYPEDFEGCLKESDAVVLSTNVMQTVTPVCFATIFSGAGPEVHGIKVYEKPVVKVETLFDVFLEAGKKTAIVSQKGNSVITIFRERNIDYLDFPTDEEAYEKTLQILKENDYDLIVVHDCEYDSVMHKVGTEAEKAAEARRTVLKRWLNVVDATDEAWKDFDRLVVFAPDHGSHMPENSSKGVHGMDVRDDAVVNHFYRWRARESK